MFGFWCYSATLNFHRNLSGSLRNLSQLSVSVDCPGSYFLLQEKKASAGPPCLLARKRKLFDFD